jgi:hypothetical protein
METHDNLKASIMRSHTIPVILKYKDHLNSAACHASG